MEAFSIKQRCKLSSLSFEKYYVVRVIVGIRFFVMILDPVNPESIVNGSALNLNAFHR